MFRVWGYPRERLDLLWQDALGTKPDVEAGRSLLRAFNQVSIDFDDRIRHGAEAERQKVRQLLFETIEGPGGFFWGDADDSTKVENPPAPTWSKLIPTAREWAASQDPYLAAIGRLLRLGHRDATIAAAWPQLKADAERDPSLVPWLAYALGKAGDEPAAQATLSTDVLEQLTAWALEASLTPRIELRASWGKLADPYAWLFEIPNPLALSRLFERALEPEAPHSARSRLLSRVEAQPWSLDGSQLRLLLEQSWMADPKLQQGSLAFVSKLDSALLGSGGSLGSAVRTRFRELFLQAIEQSPRQASNFHYTQPEPGLLRALTTQDLSDLIEREGSHEGRQQSLKRWLWLAAVLGSWPEIEPDLEALLDEPGTNVLAAAALAPLKHPTALDVLMRDGLRWSMAPPGTYLAYGAQARERLLPLCFHEDLEARQAVRGVLRGFDLELETLDLLSKEVTATLAANKLPDVETILILDSAGRDVMTDLVAGFKAQGLDTGDSYLHGFAESADFGRAVLRWAEGHPDREAAIRGIRSKLSPLVSPEAVAWRTGLAKNQPG